MRQFGRPTARSSARLGRAPTPAPAAELGFTLIELLAVILIITILMAFLIPKIPEALDAANRTACQKNLQEIYQGLLLHEQKFRDIPRESGAKFFAELIHGRVWENSQASAKKLTCPGVKPNGLPGLAGHKPEEWFADFDQIDGSYSAYAGRNCNEFPLRKFPGSGKDPLVADDNDGPEDDPMNHRTTTNVLYADGNIGTFENSLLEKEGLLLEDEGLKVGPESQVEELKKLSLD
jgi:prepilin-type N-terminal cleavage/methylation domain-containing protein